MESGPAHCLTCLVTAIPTNDVGGQGLDDGTHFPFIYSPDIWHDGPSDDVGRGLLDLFYTPDMDRRGLNLGMFGITMRLNAGSFQ